MKRLLTMTVAAATIAVSLVASAGDADARWRGRGGGFGAGIAAGILGGAIIGGAIASSRYHAPPPPGYAYYPAYDEPVPAEDCYWARVPVYNAYGDVISWRGRPRLVCP
jgi:hypothetical protein